MDSRTGDGCHQSSLSRSGQVQLAVIVFISINCRFRHFSNVKNAFDELFDDAEYLIKREK